MINNSIFLQAANKILNYLGDTIESEDTEGVIDVDYGDGILNLKLDNKIYVINKHSAAKEIWLASPISGPHHFGLVENKWKSKNGTDLLELLSVELKINFSYK